MNYLKSNYMKNEYQYEKMKQFVDDMRKNNEVLTQISDYNERMRIRYKAELGDAKSKIDSYANYILELKMNRDIYNSKYTILEESFK